jgi:hypothetical protein
MRLFRPAWDSKDWRKAVAAVEKIDDENEAELIRVARKARCLQARQTALIKLVTWDTALDLTAFNIAQDSTDSHFVIAVVKKLSDPILLARVAKEAWCKEAGLSAVKNLSAPTLLADIAKNGRYSDVRIAAVERVTDPLLLTNLIKYDNDSSIRIAASHQLVNADLEEDFLTYIIYMLGDELKDASGEREWIRKSAAKTLLAYYRRYKESPQAETIRQYQGEYQGGYSDYTDNYKDTTPPVYDDANNYSDDSEYKNHYTDTTYTINFNPEET